PVVIMTARSDYDQADAHAHGFAAYLSKPFTVASLQNVFGGEEKSSDAADSYGTSASTDSVVATSGDSVAASADSVSVLNLPPHLLDDLFGGDVEAMRETLDLFKSTTTANLILLKEALQADDYLAARAVCHKMLPMFAQLGRKEAELLRKIESHRNDRYQGWREDVENVIAGNSAPQTIV
ncbi:MAG: hypothetical protein RR555_11575, partial [Bacteroidales bacterium]